MLRQSAYLCRSILPHGETGLAVGIPAEIRRDQDLTTDDSVDLEYDREDDTLTVHFK